MSSRAWGIVLMSLGCGGCSIATLEVPRSAPPGQSEPWRRSCKKAPYAMLTDIAVGLGSAALATDVFSLSTDQDTQKGGRIAGWVLLGTFGASAVYGSYVTIECQSAAPGEQRREEQAKRLDSPKAAGFPGQVLQFQFGMTTEGANQACVGGKGSFEPGANHSLCRSRAPSLAQPDVRLEFAGRELNRVTLVYPVTAEALQATLKQVAGQAASYYGQARTGPNPWPPSCTSDGAVLCLQNGALPGRAFWGFPNGDIELRPALDGEHPVVEMRYSRYEPGG